MFILNRRFWLLLMPCWEGCISHQAYWGILASLFKHLNLGQALSPEGSGPLRTQRSISKSEEYWIYSVLAFFSYHPLASFFMGNVLSWWGGFVPVLWMQPVAKVSLHASEAEMLLRSLLMKLYLLHPEQVLFSVTGITGESLAFGLHAFVCAHNGRSGTGLR